MSPDIFTLDAVEEFVEQFTNVDNSGTILGICLFGNLNQLVKMLLTIRVKLETHPNDTSVKVSFYCELSLFLVLFLALSVFIWV